MRSPHGLGVGPGNPQTQERIPSFPSFLHLLELQVTYFWETGSCTSLGGDTSLVFP